MFKISKHGLLRSVVLCVLLLSLLLTAYARVLVKDSPVADTLFVEADMMGFSSLAVQELQPHFPEGTQVVWFRNHKTIVYQGRDVIKVNRYTATSSLDYESFKLIAGEMHNEGNLHMGWVVSKDFAEKTYASHDVIGIELTLDGESKRIIGVVEPVGLMRGMFSNDVWVLELEDLYGSSPSYYTHALALTPEGEKKPVFNGVLNKLGMNYGGQRIIPSTWLVDRLDVAFNIGLILVGLTLVYALYGLALMSFNVFVTHFKDWNRTIEWPKWLLSKWLSLGGLILVLGLSGYFLSQVMATLKGVSLLDRLFYPEDPTSIYSVVKTLKFWLREMFGNPIEASGLLMGAWFGVYKLALMMPLFQVVLHVVYLSRGKKLEVHEAVKSDTLACFLCSVIVLVGLVVFKVNAIAFSWVMTIYGLVVLTSVVKALQKQMA